jgi:hypothetical protein
LVLLFPKGKGGNERDVEAFFYGHGEVIVCLPGNCNGMRQVPWGITDKVSDTTAFTTFILSGLTRLR